MLLANFNLAYVCAACDPVAHSNARDFEQIQLIPKHAFSGLKFGISLVRLVGSGYCIATCMHVTRSPRPSPSTLTYHSVPQIVQNTVGRGHIRKMRHFLLQLRLR